MRMRIALACVVVLLAAAMAAAQFGRYRDRGLNDGTVEGLDGSVQCCGVEYSTARGGDGGDWSVHWRRADQYLSIRLSGLTETPVSTDNEGMPKHLLIKPANPGLFHCRFI